MNSKQSRTPKRGMRAILGYTSALAGFAALALPGVAMAQDTPADPAAESEEEIVVVGSRIRRDNFNSAAPIELITREESTRAGFTTTSEVLQSAAANGGTAQLNNNFSGLVTDGGSGVNTLGLRGFGPTSTLILLNGRRLTPAGTRGSVGAADLNTIPTALVDRIEILKDGASSVYGSDAVAGVVNIITRQNVEDWVIEGQINHNELGGGQQRRLSLAGGGAFGALSLSGSLDIFERDAVLMGDREWATCPEDVIRDGFEFLEDIDPFTGEVSCHSANFANSGGATINTIGTSARPGIGGPGAANLGNFTRWRPNSNITDPARLDGFEGVNGGGLAGLANRDKFDPLMLQEHLFNPTRNMNVFLQAEWDVGGGHEIYGELLFSRRESGSPLYRQLALDYPNTVLLPLELQAGAVQNPNSTVANPPPSGVPGSLMPAPYATQVRAFIGFGLTTFSEEVEYTRAVGGVRGDFFLPDWRYDFSVYAGQNDAHNSGETFLVDRVFNSMAITTVIPVGTPANLIRETPQGVPYICSITATNPAYGCIPSPALTTDTIAGRLPQDFRNWILQNATGSTTYDEVAASFIVDGPIFEMPAGEVQGAFGVEWRTAEIDDTPDQNALDANFFGLTSGGATRGEDSVFEVFGEVEVPLLRDAPFAEQLTLNVSSRYTDYDSYGADTTYKASGIWEPIENLTFRATQGTSYRAPALFEQFLGPTSGFQGPNFDPCDDYGAGDPTTILFQNCDAEIGDVTFQQNNGVTIFGGGGAAQGLAAETSKNFTLGFVWQPLNDVDAWGELSLAVDRFSIEVSDQVTQLGEQNILELCYLSPNFPTDPFCAFRERDVSNRLTVFDNYVNIATQIARGFDYALRYSHTLFDGTITGDLSVTHFTQQRQRFFEVDPVSGDPVDFTEFNNNVGSPELSADLDVNYETGPWNFRYGLTWINDTSNYEANGEDPAASPFVLSTPNVYIHNVSVQFREDDWQLTAGVRNLNDKGPPDYSAIDPLVNRIGRSVLFSQFEPLYYGRQFFVNLSKTF